MSAPLNNPTAYCLVGEPLRDLDGNVVYSGRGSPPNRCPPATEPFISPTDRFAVCCWRNASQENITGLETTKPGICPKPRGPGQCRDSCRNDSTCPGDLKCCQNGCGVSCMRPAANLTDPCLTQVSPYNLTDPCLTQVSPYNLTDPCLTQVSPYNLTDPCLTQVSPYNLTNPCLTQVSRYNFTNPCITQVIRYNLTYPCLTQVSRYNLTDPCLTQVSHYNLTGL
ncbi:uncharacterized protein LOC121370237 [Gigantopelta aegis]|uniref:uncharacterized protein LOC121370237 n=1 Tax=Gigantopelta aegis TaxID=1735272 RepID=UPI001B887B2E|nr:uncharacterized protein LOC121370237 [Gigantopelta aegis]